MRPNARIQQFFSICLTSIVGRILPIFGTALEGRCFAMPSADRQKGRRNHPSTTTLPRSCKQLPSRSHCFSQTFSLVRPVAQWRLRRSVAVQRRSRYDRREKKPPRINFRGGWEWQLLLPIGIVTVPVVVVSINAHIRYCRDKEGTVWTRHSGYYRGDQTSA